MSGEGGTTKVTVIAPRKALSVGKRGDIRKRPDASGSAVVVSPRKPRPVLTGGAAEKVPA